MDEDNSALFDFFVADTSAGKFAPEYKEAVDKKLEEEKHKRHEKYYNLHLDPTSNVERESEKIEKQVRETNEQNRKELQETIRDSYGLHDLFWCRSELVWH